MLEAIKHDLHARLLSTEKVKSGGNGSKGVHLVSCVVSACCPEHTAFTEYLKWMLNYSVSHPSDYHGPIPLIPLQ